LITCFSKEVFAHEEKGPQELCDDYCRYNYPLCFGSTYALSGTAECEPELGVALEEKKEKKQILSMNESTPCNYI
jgi:hypothetical protein